MKSGWVWEVNLSWTPQIFMELQLKEFQRSCWKPSTCHWKLNLKWEAFLHHISRWNSSPDPNYVFFSWIISFFLFQISHVAVYTSFIPRCYDQCTHSGYTDRGAHHYCAENESAPSTLKLVVKFQSSLVMMCNIQGFRCLINAMTSKNNVVLGKGVKSGFRKQNRTK